MFQTIVEALASGSMYFLFGSGSSSTCADIEIEHEQYTENKKIPRERNAELDVLYLQNPGYQ
jgi:hypothetical protein